MGGRTVWRRVRPCPLRRALRFRGRLAAKQLPRQGIGEPASNDFVKHGREIPRRACVSMRMLVYSS